MVVRNRRSAVGCGGSANDMVAELKALGGLHTLEDFAAQADSASYVTPSSVPYRGVELVELPPSNQGIVALIMLKMLERLGKPKGTKVQGAEICRVRGAEANAANAKAFAERMRPVLGEHAA